MQTLIANNKNTYTDSDLNFCQINNDFLNFVSSFGNFGYTYTSDSIKSGYSSLNDKELTSFCMEISEKSLKDAWDNEDDERWNNFLIDK